VDLGAYGASVVDWSRVRGRAATWPEWGRSVGRRAATWPDGFSDFSRAASEQIATWIKAEVAPGRLMPWLPVAFGLGVAIYFSAEREPACWAAVLLALTSAAAAVLCFRRPVGFALALGVAASAIGFATATVKSALVAHPILRNSVSNISVTGFVEQQEERERTDRIVVRVRTIEGDRLEVNPDRIRLSVRKGMAPPVGAFVSLKARLNPPLSRLRPGSYDFARDLYFQSIA
jgi:competence protein ComEC